MLQAGPAIRVTIHLNRDTGAPHGFLVDEIISFLLREGVRGATVLQPYAGYGEHHRLHVSGAGDVTGLHLPAVIYFIEQQERFDVFRDALLALVTDGLVEAHPTTVLKSVSSAEKVIS